MSTAFPEVDTERRGSAVSQSTIPVSPADKTRRGSSYGIGEKSRVRRMSVYQSSNNSSRSNSHSMAQSSSNDNSEDQSLEAFQKRLMELADAPISTEDKVAQVGSKYQPVNTTHTTQVLNTMPRAQSAVSTISYASGRLSRNALRFRIETPDPEDDEYHFNLRLPKNMANVVHTNTLSAFSERYNNQMVNYMHVLETARATESGVERFPDTELSSTKDIDEFIEHKKQLDEQFARAKTLKSLKRNAEPEQPVPTTTNPGGIKVDISANSNNPKKDSPNKPKKERLKIRAAFENTTSVNIKLQKKLEMLKDDMDQMNKFEMRVKDLKKEREKGKIVRKNIIQRNKLIHREYVPEVMAATMALRSELNELRMLEVQRNKIEIDEYKKENKSRKMRDQANREEMERKRREFLAKQAKLQYLQKKWCVMIVLGSRQSFLSSKLREHRRSQFESKEKHIAARTIQLIFREYSERRSREKTEKAHTTLKNFFNNRLVSKWREKKRKESIQIIHEFMHNVDHVGAIMHVVKKYRLCVVQLQKSWRSYLMIRSARLALLKRHWDQLEKEYPMIMAKKREQQAKKNGTSSSRRGGRRGNRDGQLEVKEYPKVLETIKHELLLDDLMKRKKIYWDDLREYLLAVSNHKNMVEIAEAKARLNNTTLQLPDEPIKPVFRVLPPREAMIKMVRQGIKNTVQELANSKETDLLIQTSTSVASSSSSSTGRRGSRVSRRG